MKWATRKGVKFDRSACAWLILRHIDPQAEFEYHTPADMDAAIAAGARPFHNVGFLGPGSRKQSSFSDLLDESGLEASDPALTIVREYVDKTEIGSEGGHGDDALRAIAKGMNALAHSDDEMVQLMLPVWDAIYAFAQRKVAGKDKWASSEPGWGGG